MKSMKNTIFNSGKSDVYFERHKVCYGSYYDCIRHKNVLTFLIGQEASKTFMSLCDTDRERSIRNRRLMTRTIAVRIYGLAKVNKVESEYYENKIRESENAIISG